MKDFFSWCEANGITVPDGNEINGKWFSDHRIPMIVSCSCCGMTMAAPSAFIDDDGSCYCKHCIED